MLIGFTPGMIYELAYLWALRRAGVHVRGALVDILGKAWLCMGHCTDGDSSCDIFTQLPFRPITT